ncbi:uncharacterized protein K02A2.6-like [Acyrthosiphon pisum]|uniref:RNA-directed DNA polymerase n=1 Tax=Acyrthosiphon pisum TaxID=7029 RepID=A0A8R2H9D2_ACYPI|nr:uncharacterized protein K02A2.6-like [Acyrthosiphon pisum]|eukprot:XP_016664851.1 PREDICTED: uncharacterized protein K02A2.6-like [Acyrthosiphon pisum]
MNKLGITIRGISKIEVESTNKNNKLELLINEFEELFEEKIGKYKYEKVTLKVKEECTPIFCKPRPIPFAFKKKVKDELDRLEREEIIQKVETSEWGTPLVPVIKPDGSIRLCADYKTTVNKYLVDINHPSFRGHKIGSEGIERDKNKVKAMLNAVEPKSVTEVKAFTGMVNYYAKFIPNLSTLRGPIYNLLKKRNLSVLLSCDASEYGIGAVLMHIFENGERRPVGYASRILTVAEKKYSVIQKEALAVFWGVKKFSQYLSGRKFFLETDHKPLLALYGENKGIPVMASGRIQRWTLYLSEFDYQVLHVKGNNNKMADGLSRLPDKDDVQTQTNETDYVDFMENTMPIDYEILKVETKKDKEFNLVIKYLNEGWPIKVSEELKPYAIRKEEICIDKDILMWGYRILIPKILRKNLLKEVHSTHMGMSKMKTLCRSYMWWPGLDKDIENWVQSCDACLQSRSEPILAEPKKWEEANCPMDRVHIDFSIFTR